MTANEAVNELRRRACADGVAGWTWNYDVEHGTIALSLTAGEKHASRSVPSDKIFLDEHGRAIPGGDGSHLVNLYEELECNHETGDMPEVCPICGKIIDWSWFTFKEADE
jgi:hypothetical protein